MNSEDKEKQIPCFVGTGVVASKKDMVRVLRGLDHVKYTELIDSNIQTEDEAFILDVFSSDTDGTVIFNHRMYINVNNFEYLRIKSNFPGIVELVEGHRTLKLESLSDPLNNKELLINEAIDNRVNSDSIFEEDIILDEDF